MDGLNQILDRYLIHYNKLFWLLFALAGGIFIITVILGYVSLLYLDIILGVALVVVGVHMLGEEFHNRTLRNDMNESVRTINELLQWAEKSYDYTRAFKDRHEKRLFSLDQKRADHEAKVEDQFRSAVKKIIEMENKLNKTLKSLAQGMPITPAPQVSITTSAPIVEEALPSKPAEPRLSDLNKSQLKAVEFLRKTGRITNRDYRKMFRVSDKKAYNELTFLERIGLIRREGQGRNTHYVTAF
jgi:hypothetical protein